MADARMLDVFITRPGFYSHFTCLTCFTFPTRSNFSQASSRIALIYQSVCCRTIADRLQNDGIAQFFWTGK